MADVTMPKLNLPDFSERLRLRLMDGCQQIFDPVRLVWVALTPEEWVRQNMTLYISDRLRIPLQRFAVEAPITYNNLRKRCDTIIYDEKGVPMIIVEYKRPDVTLTQRVFDQVAVYNLRLNVPFLIVSNGMQHLMCQVDAENKRYIFSDKLNYGD